MASNHLRLEYIYGILLFEFIMIVVCAAQVPSCYVTSNCTGQPIDGTVSLTECCLRFGASYDLSRRCLPCPEMGCPRNAERDVVFVVDTSQISPSAFSSGIQQLRGFVENITLTLKSNFNASFGLITFDYFARLEFNITRHTKLDTLLPAINPGIPYNPDRTIANITSGLSLLLSGSMPGGILQLRNGTSKIAVVIIHSRHFGDNSSLLSIAHSLHAANIFDVYVVGIGDFSYDQLQLIATDSSYISRIDFYHGGAYRYALGDIVEIICSIPIPQVQITVLGYEAFGNETLQNVTIGDPLTLVCTVTAANLKDTTNSFEAMFTWSSRSSGEVHVLREANNVVGDIRGDSVIYTDSLTISSLSATDNGTDLLCIVFINASRVTFNFDSFTLIFPTPVCFTNTNCGKESAIGDLSLLTFRQCCFELSGAAYASPGQCLLCPKTDCTIGGVKDIVFVIDTSRSSRSYQFQWIREFVDNITTSLKLNSPASSVAVILFSNTAQIQFNLKAHTNLSTLSPAINPGLPYNGSDGRDTAAALNLLLTSAQNGSLGIRNETSNIAIIITGGRSNNNHSTRLAAAALHAANIFDVYAIGYDSADINEINTIASDPNFVYFDRDFIIFNLEELQTAVGDQLCSLPFPKISYQPSTLQFRSPGAIICSVTITSTVDPSSVKLTWINADSIITADNRVTISPTTVTENPSSFTYTRTIQFTYLIVEDEKNYTCSVTLGKMEKSQSAMLNLSIPTPVVEVTSINGFEFRKPATLECNVTTVRGITSRVDIAWIAQFNSSVVKRVENATANIINNSVVYTDRLTTSPLSYLLRGTLYICQVIIHTASSVISDGNISIYFTAPSCYVSFNCGGNPINDNISFTDCCLNFGISYDLNGQCHSCPSANCTRRDAKDAVFLIDTSSSIGEFRFQLVREMIESIIINLKINSPGTLIDVITFDNFARYQSDISSHTTLSTLLPAINPGLPYYQGLRTNTGDALRLLLLGSAPGGFLQLRNDTTKVAIVITDGFSSDPLSLRSAANSLHAANIFEVYAVGIGNNNITELRLIANDSTFLRTFFLDRFAAQSLAEGVVERLCRIPNPTVTIVTSDEQLLGESLTLECRVEAVRGINGTAEIIWTVHDTGFEVRRVGNISGSSISNYTDKYTIPVLRTSYAFTLYQCKVLINTTSQLVGRGFFSLNNVTEPPQIIINPPSSPIRVPVGSQLPLYCVAVKGFPLPVVQWYIYSQGIPAHPLTQFYQQIYLVPTDSPHTTTYTCVGTQPDRSQGINVTVTVIVENPCGRLRAPRNGDVTMITTDGQQVAFFSCDRGFTMRGSHVLKCNNGKWNSPRPTCHSISNFCQRRCNF